MHITLIAASLAVSASSSTAPIAGIETILNFSGRSGITSSVTVTSASGRNGASIGLQCSADGAQWHTLTPTLPVDSTGTKGDSNVSGGVDYESIPVACQISGVRVRAVANGNGGVTNFTITQMHLEVL